MPNITASLLSPSWSPEVSLCPPATPATSPPGQEGRGAGPCCPALCRLHADFLSLRRAGWKPTDNKVLWKLPGPFQELCIGKGKAEPFPAPPGTLGSPCSHHKSPKTASCPQGNARCALWAGRSRFLSTGAWTPLPPCTMESIDASLATAGGKQPHTVLKQRLGSPVSPAWAWGTSMAR